MRFRIFKYGCALYVNVTPYEKPEWLVKLLLPFYWKRMPWAETMPAVPDTFDELKYEWAPVKTLIGKPGYQFCMHNGEIHTKIYSLEEKTK